MRGQAKFIEYILTILLGVIFLVIVSSLIYVFYTTSLTQQIREGLKQITLQVSSNILEVYETGQTSKAQPSNFTSILLSEMNLNLPSSVSRRNYEIYLVSANPVWSTVNLTIDNQSVSTIAETSGAKIVAQTTQDPVVEVEYALPNIDLGVQGKVENGKEDKLSYYRYNINGTIRDAVILGKAEILIDYLVQWEPE